MIIEGYKFFLKGYKSKYGDFQFKVGEKYEHKGKIEMCRLGFHFSRTLQDAFYYNGNITYHCCKVEGSGEIDEEIDKVVCSKIYIKEELDFNRILEKLSKIPYWVIRWMVAANPNCSVNILSNLSNDGDDDVKEAVITNSKCSVEILEKLSKNPRFKHVIIKLPHCPIKMLEEESDGGFFIREKVAANSSCPVEILEKLSKDQFWEVRCKVAKNVNCPKYVLKELSEDKDIDVRYAAMNSLERK